MKKHKDKNRRKEKYDLLIAAGFNSREATRYKDHSDAKIEQYIRERQELNKKLDSIARGA